MQVTAHSSENTSHVIGQFATVNEATSKYHANWLRVLEEKQKLIKAQSEAASSLHKLFGEASALGMNRESIYILLRDTVALAGEPFLLPLEAREDPSAAPRPDLSARFEAAAAKPDTESLPEKAPALWLERKNRKESAPDFIRRIYGPWIGKGLGQVHLRRLDRSLYLALHKWLQKPGNDLPADLPLPTLKELNDQKLAALGVSGAPYMRPHEVREGARLYQAAQRRFG